MRNLRLSLRLVFALVASGALPLVWTLPAGADQFSYVDQVGATVDVEARLIASGQGTLVLELANGQYRLIPQSALRKREPGEGPKPLDAAGVVAELAVQFGPERFRSMVKE